MKFWQIIQRSWRYYWQIHLAMLLAVALTTAVLAGALTVGDSMRGSLRQLTLDRLGPIDEVILSQSFFDGKVFQDWKTTDNFKTIYSDAVNTIHFPAATIERTTGATVNSDSLQSWASVQVWGLPAELADWNWAKSDIPVPGNNEVVINQTAAARMGLQQANVGQLLTVRLGKPSDVPTESFIATKDDSVTSLPRLKLIAIIPDAGLGRLSLTPGTEIPGLAFLNLRSLRRAIPDATRDTREDVELFNAVLVQSRADVRRDPSTLTAGLKQLRLNLADAGLQWKHVELDFVEDEAPEKILDYYSISSRRMLIDQGQESAIEEAIEGLPRQKVLTYLANQITHTPADDVEIPFSMVSAIDANEAFPLYDRGGQQLPFPKPGQILLNRWAAERLKVSSGETIVIKYYEPETVDGDEVEREARFELAGIVDLTRPSEGYRTLADSVEPAEFSKRPTTGNDPWLTPEVPGVTDAASIERWDLPFETSVGSDDEEYWGEYRTTPKAFVSLQDGVQLWGSRFGSYTSYRIPANAIDENELAKRLRNAVSEDVNRVGFQIMPVKWQGLQGSQGSTPFDVLFLMFSMFVIASSLMLSGLFFRLGMQQRSKELGLWLALGFTEKQARRFWILESLGSTLAGLVLGSVLGIGYAWTIAYLMRTSWVGAVASPFLFLHWSWLSLFGGAVASLVVSLLVIWWSIRQATSVSARSLLTGGWSDQDGQQRQGRWWHACRTRRILLVLALLLSIAGFFAVGDTQAVVFLTGGFLALTAVLLFVFDRLVHRTTGGDFDWAAVSQLNLSRQPLRSMIIISLVGLATFLIVAVSAFRLSPTERGTAGFDYLATTDVGVLEDFQDLLAPADQSSGLVGYGFRFHDGEHASCNNPFQARLPQVLGVDPRFVKRFDDPEVPAFAWVGSQAATNEEKQNPWNLLTKPTPAGEPIPVVMDKNTAWYSLKVYLPGSQFRINFPDAGEVTFQLVGLLDNAVLQGVLLVGDADYVRLFPTDAGRRYFLIQQSDNEAPATARQRLSEVGLELKNYGWQIESADEALSNYMAVQNTYLSAFQSLGSLGLLLGTIGLIVAQYRSLLERRKEMALMQALGFQRNRIQHLITSETVRLILNGFIAGVAGALVCVLPHWITGSASIPWLWLGLTLGSILLLGLVASIVLGRVAMKGRLVSLLRAE